MAGVSARGAYADAVAWLRAARPRRVARGRFARRAFGASFAAGVVVLGALGLADPSLFRAGAGGRLRDLQVAALAVAVAVATLVLAANGRRLVWLARRVQEPLRRPLEHERAFEGVASNLAAAPQRLRTRFALAWVWTPALLAVAGVTFAFSTAYFVVDAILARGLVGWGQLAFAAANALLSLAAFGAGAVRFATWRVAASAHRDATSGY